MPRRHIPSIEMTYDERSYDLAAYFLSDHQITEMDRVELARTIQRAIEDWMSDHLVELEGLEAKDADAK